MFGGGCLVPADLARRLPARAGRRARRGPGRCATARFRAGCRGPRRSPRSRARRDRAARPRRDARGQAAERGVDVELIGDGVVERRAPVRGLGSDLDRRRSARPAARFVERGVGRDAVAPRRELRASVEGVDAARDREQRLLRRVERVVGIAEHPAADRVHQPGVPAQQRVERGTIASRGGRGELVVAIVGLHRSATRLATSHRRRGRPSAVALDPGQSRSRRGPTWTPTTGPMWPDDDLGAGDLRPHELEELVEVGRRRSASRRSTRRCPPGSGRA